MNGTIALSSGERTETVQIIFPRIAGVAQWEYRERLDEAFRVILEDAEVRAVSEPDWAWDRLTQDELDRLEGEAVSCLNAGDWRVTAEVRVSASAAGGNDG